MILKPFYKTLAFQKLQIFCESILKVYGKGNLDLSAQFLILALKAVIAPIFVCLYQWDYHIPLLFCLFQVAINLTHLWKHTQLKNLPASYPSVQFSRSVMSDSLQPYESQHARPPCPSPTPGVHSDSCPLSR